MEGNITHDSRKKNWKMISWMMILYALLTLVSFYGCGNKSHGERQVESPLKVEVEKISTGSVDEELRYSGSLQANNAVQLGFAVSGRVSKVEVQEGQHVTNGQLLATVETVDYKYALAITSAVLEQAQDSYKRADELYRKGSLTDKDYVAAKTSLSQAVANNNLSAKRLADCHLIAPFTGLITSRFIESGASSLPGVPAFALMKTDFVYAQAAISESDINRLSVGSKAEVTVDAVHKTFNGTIGIINPQADQQSRTYWVKIRIPNSNGDLLPGMIAEIKIATGRKNPAITIPPEAVVQDAEGITYVFVVNQSKRAVKKRIAVGMLSGKALAIISGLQQGESLVVKGQKGLQDGQLVSAD